MKNTRLTAILVAAMLFPAASLTARQHTIRAALEPPGSRRPAPVFHLPDASGDMVALSDFSGKPVVLTLWATECGGCRLELPTFSKLDQTYRSDDLRIVGVSMDVTYDGLKSTEEAWARVTPFARAHGLGYTILVDDGSVEKAYKVTAMPATYLIDKHGRIAATYIGVVDADNLTANIRALLAEGA